MYTILYCRITYCRMMSNLLSKNSLSNFRPNLLTPRSFIVVPRLRKNAVDGKSTEVANYSRCLSRAFTAPFWRPSRTLQRDSRTPCATMVNVLPPRRLRYHGEYVWCFLDAWTNAAIELRRWVPRLGSVREAASISILLHNDRTQWFRIELQNFNPKPAASA